LPFFDIIGLIVVTIALVFIWIRRNKQPSAVRSRRRLGLIVAGIGALLLLATLAVPRILPLRPAALLIVIFGLLYWLLNRIDKA
jgi:multisubunit Na+/H+ antiporter MnhB subunit